MAANTANISGRNETVDSTSNRHDGGASAHTPVSGYFGIGIAALILVAMLFLQSTGAGF